MMKRSLQKRVTNVGERLRNAPVNRETLNAAFEHFVKTGELPAGERLSLEVTQRAMTAARNPMCYHKHHDAVMRELRAMQACDPGGRHPDDVRRQLFSEAVHGDEIVRHVARELLALFARLGVDLAEPFPFNYEIDMPECGSLGLHLLGWPDCLIRPPFEDRARAAIERLEALREPLHAMPDWRERIERAAADSEAGRPPEDELLHEALLASREMQHLLADIVRVEALLR